MEHKIKVNFQKIRLESLKRKEIEELFNSQLKEIKKCSVKILENHNPCLLKIKIYRTYSPEFIVKYGIIISKKVGKATYRNSLKRRIREILIKSLKSRHILPEKDCFTFIFFVKKL
ncbi:MAG: ribonuclease P protein component [Candidatus Calescibacterium sp.]|nr:ribonuclease P protein component [Candidatus Calescibacterium sp.]MCX7972618.1 ribonuclease P protein component [bacterium]MDW8194784.1 ribonuclease P protein component [Candidatus Calescibacterium sp.]